jgi:hypothetical protein
VGSVDFEDAETISIVLDEFRKPGFTDEFAGDARHVHLLFPRAAVRDKFPDSPNGPNEDDKSIDLCFKRPETAQLALAAVKSLAR